MTAVVLVTGSSTGFDRLSVQELARRGHRVAATMRGLTTRNAEHATALRDVAAREGWALTLHELDVADEASVAGAVRDIHADSGRLDVVVNNVGVGSWGLTEGYTAEQVWQIFDSNYMSTVRVARAVAPIFREQRHGLLIQVSSGVGRFVMPFMGHYSAAKHAVDALAEALSYELAPFGVESAIVEPGSFPTEGSLTKLVRPDDEHRVLAYGDLAEQAEGMYQANDQTNRGPTAPDPHDVARAIADLVEMPVGSRPLRTTVGPPPAPQAAQINEVAGKVQAETLAYMGLGALLSPVTGD